MIQSSNIIRTMIFYDFLAIYLFYLLLYQCVCLAWYMTSSTRIQCLLSVPSVHLLLLVAPLHQGSQALGAVFVTLSRLVWRQSALSLFGTHEMFGTMKSDHKFINCCEFEVSLKAEQRKTQQYSDIRVHHSCSSTAWKARHKTNKALHEFLARPTAWGKQEYLFYLLAESGECQVFIVHQVSKIKSSLEWG